MMVVLSWYENLDLDLDLFQTFRSNGKYVTDPVWIEKRKKLVYSFVQYAKVHEFVEGPSFLDVDPEDEGDEEEEDEEGADEDQSDKEAEDAGASKTDDAIPPSSTEVPSTKAYAPTTAAQVAAHELGTAFPPEE
jgi:hypothetical protein